MMEREPERPAPEEEKAVDEVEDLDVPETGTDEVSGGARPPGNEDEDLDDLEIQR